MVSYDELKGNGKLLSQDEATEFYQFDGKVYMVSIKDGNSVQLVENK